MTILTGFLFLIVGLIASFSPQTAWYLSIGWKLRDAEPSDAALIWNRISGVVLTLIGIIVITTAFSTLISENSSMKQFKQKIAAGEIKNITIQSAPKKRLNQDELKEVVPLISESKLIPFDAPQTFGFTNSAELEFYDGTNVTIIFIGNGIELHPDGLNKIFKIENLKLEKWFRNYFENAYQ